MNTTASILGCISYYSYIKPQPAYNRNVKQSSCISYYSYIKPQPLGKNDFVELVVYRTIPTSNHNSVRFILLMNVLYIVLFLHQTTTTTAKYW